MLKSLPRLVDIRCFVDVVVAGRKREVEEGEADDEDLSEGGVAAWWSLRLAIRSTSTVSMLAGSDTCVRDTTCIRGTLKECTDGK